MKTFAALISVMLVLISPALASGALIPGDTTKMAVYIHPLGMASSSANDRADLYNCLLTHLDYYLWQKGLNFDFVFTDTAMNNEDLLAETGKRGYDRLLIVNPRAEMKLKKVTSPIRAGEAKKSAYIYFLKIKVKLGYRDKNDRSVTFDKKTFEARTSDHWVEMADSGSTAGRTYLAEPPDFVIKRLLSAALTFLPSGNYSPPPSADRIPVFLAIDSRIHNDWQSGSDNYLLSAIEYISYTLQRQFGFGVVLAGQEYITIPAVPFSRIDALFKSFAETEPRRPDTLTVAVFRPERSVEFFERGRNIQIGLSDLGKQVSLVAELFPPGKATEDWKVFINGQLLLHEIGHLLGAIHVSDIGSIMLPKTEWVSSDRFDLLNRRLISEIHHDKSHIGSIARYFDLLADALETSGYKLADYPAIFFSFYNINHKDVFGERFETDAFRKSIPYATQGYMYLLRKNNAFAEELFYRALAADPGQGSIHYYLSRVTFGNISRYHLLQAARIGYYQAIEDARGLKRK